MSAQRILLAVPVMRDPYEKGGGANVYFANIGLAYLGAYLRERGHAVRIFDGVIHPTLDALDAVIDEFRPTHLGLTAFTVNVKAAHRTAAHVKARNPEISIALGGSHAIGAALESLEEFSAIDHAIGDEGEDSYARLVESDGSREQLATIPALAWRDDGTARLNPRGSYPDFDDLPVPAWDLFELEHYSLLPFRHDHRPDVNEFQVLSARGCPFRCSYCSHASGFKVRKRAATKLVAEMEWLVRDFDARAILFATETFTLDRSHTVELLEGMIAAGLPRHLSWGCFTRVDTLDPDLIDVMHRSGCGYVSMGLESGTQDVLDSVDRGHRVADVPAIIRELQRRGIAVHSNFLIGLPGETRETIRETIDLAVKSRIDYASFCIFVPYPGSALARSLETSDTYRIKTRDWDRYRNQAGTYLISNPTLSEHDVSRLHLWAYIRFYGRLRYLLRLVKFVTPRMMLSYAVDNLRRGLAPRRDPVSPVPA